MPSLLSRLGIQSRRLGVAICGIALVATLAGATLVSATGYLLDLRGLRPATDSAPDLVAPARPTTASIAPNPASSKLPQAGSSTRPHQSATGSVIPRVPGKFAVTLRSQKQRADGTWEVQVEEAQWEVSETAIIICDMWAEHQCDLAFYRVERLAERIEETIAHARDHGAAIIHAPGEGGVRNYEGTHFREIAKKARHFEAPVPIRAWCGLGPDEPELPIVCTRLPGAGVSGCDDPVVPAGKQEMDLHQHPAIKMVGYDAVTQDGQELYNLLQQEQRKNIVLMGVQTNICVLGQPYGIRQLKYLGKNVVLCRNLTDALYDPRDPPFVSHTRGTELVVEHIERHWCPSIESSDLVEVIPGSSD